MSEFPLKTVFLFGVLLGTVLPLQALEFGAASPKAVLGAPLDFEVVLEGAPADESLRRCVQADVAMGAVLLPPQAVSIGLRSRDSRTWVRVRTTSVVDDPLVGVVVSVGCPARLTRRFVVLADPATVPRATLPSRLQVLEEDKAPPPPTHSSRSQDPITRSGAPGVIGPEASGDHGSVEARAGRVASRSPAPTAANPPSRLEMLAPSIGSGRDQPGPVVSPQPAVTPGRHAPRADTVAPTTPDRVSPDTSDPGADLGSTALARVQSLENSVLALRAEARQQRDALARLETALAEAEFRSHLAWGAAALCALALSLVTGWTLRRPRAPSRAGSPWAPESRAPAHLMPTEPGLGSVDRSLQGLSAPAVAPDPASGGSLERDAPADDNRGSLTEPPQASVDGGRVRSPAEIDPGEGAAERTRLMASSAVSMSAPLQAVPVEESLDLEQQVEFLTVLGREDSAVEFLSEHLRKTGGTHPTPFLKLMDLHRRRGEREAYERVRARFNQRFNAVAAAFGAPVVPRLGLQAHPDLMRSIERVWPQPLDAVTLLENLMFRSASREPLDVSALEEVVFLHDLARNLEQQVAPKSITVDVLLPLGEVQTDPWPSIAETEFHIDGIEMEPMRPVSGPAAARDSRP